MGEVQDSAHPRHHHAVGHGLRRARGNRDDPDLEPQPLGLLLQRVHVEDVEIAPLLVDPLGAHVEHRGEIESLATEFLVREERRADVPRAHQGDLPPAVQAQDETYLFLEARDEVPQAALAEIAEVGKVLPDLCGGDAAQVGQALRGDGADPFQLQLFQDPVIIGEAADRRGRDPRVQLLLLALVLLLDPGDVDQLVASSRLMSRTPWVFRPISEISETLVRITIPPRVMSIT